MRKFIILAISLVALAIPTLALAGTTNVGNCTFTTNDQTKTMSLVADCSTATTVLVKDGWTLDGKGFTITAVDGPTASFNGAVVQNVGTTMHVKNLKIDGGATTYPENCNRVFNGVAFMAAGGSIKGVTLTNIGRPADTGCQLGRAIVVWNTDQNTDASSAPLRSVTIEGNVVSNYNKNGIDVRGHVNATIIKNTVTGSTSNLVARNGIVVYGAATVAQVDGNTVSGNNHPAMLDGAEATGILVWDASVTIDKKNKLSGNQVDIDIVAGGQISGKKYSA